MKQSQKLTITIATRCDSLTNNLVEGGGQVKEHKCPRRVRGFTVMLKRFGGKANALYPLPRQGAGMKFMSMPAQGAR